MADDIPFANGRGPAPRRKMFAAPFGALQSADSPDIQYGDGRTGPAPREPVNALAARPIASPFGMLPTAGFTSQPPPPSVYDPAPTLAQDRPPASPFGIAPPGTIPPPPSVNAQPPPESSSPPPNVPAGSVLTPFGWLGPDDINTLARVLRRRF